MNQLQGGVNCTKYLLIAFNLVFLLSGLGLIVAGTYVQLQLKDYFGLIGGSVSSAAALLIAIGVITLFVAFFGFCGALTENRKFVRIYMVMLTIITVLQIAVGITGFVLWDKLKRQLGDYLLATVIRQDKVWDVIHQAFRCCGLFSPYDWQNLAGLQAVPPSCCASPTIGCNFTTSFSQGCLGTVSTFVESKVYIIGAIGTAFSFLQLFGFIFAGCLSRALGKEYEKV